MNYLVLDVGGSAIKYALMNKEADIIQKGKVTTPKDSFESFREEIGKIYDQYKDEIEGIAMSMPGRLDSDRGYAYTGGALHYNYEVEIVELLKERCPVKITIENDGKCAALGEYWKGTLKDCQHGVVVVIGTGLGGGLIIDGKLHKGSNFFAGEFSGVLVNNTIDRSKSAWANQNGVRGLLGPIAKAKGVPLEEMSGIKAFELIKNEDEEAIKVFDLFCYRIGLQLYNLQNLFDPDKIAIGGGISAQNILINAIRDKVDQIEQEILNAPGQATYIKPSVVRCELSNDANLVGALYSYIVTEE